MSALIGDTAAPAASPTPFDERGVAGPVGVFGAAEAARLALLLETQRWMRGAARRFGDDVPPKEIATRSATYFRLATDPRILDLVTGHLGPDVVLWGASVALAAPGYRHHWHVDVETSAATPGQTLSVWIPLRGSGPGSGLEVLPGSHRLAVSAQEARARRGVTADEVDRDGPEPLAAELGLDAAAERLVARPGEAIAFDGRLWHASVNDRGTSRRALLLQYATPDAPLRRAIPDRYEWPFELGSEPPRCLLVSGTDHSAANLVVPPPTGWRRRHTQLAPRVEHLDAAGTAEHEEPAAGRHTTFDTDGFRSEIMFTGSTATRLHVIAHVSSLAPGHTPHEPHTHPEEEVLVLLDGALDVTLVEPDGTRCVERLETGGVLHYPLDRPHTITGAGERPARYVILKWRGARLKQRIGVQPAMLAPRVDPEPVDGELSTSVVFEGPTRYLRRLQCHRSTMPVGGGYGEHADAYDVALVTLDGTVDTLGREVGPHSLVWYPAGSRHGLRNVGDHDAHYVVFELHGDTLGSRVNPHQLRELGRRVPRIPAKIARMARGDA